MVIDKPAGMAVHGGSGLSWGVIDAIRKMRPHLGVDLVHRLDRETSGCMLLALSGEALKNLGTQMQNNVIEKRYLCLLDGQMEQELIEVREPISKFERSGQRYMAVDASGKDAHTTLRRLQDFGGYSFAEAHLHTGRTHQIRVHAHHLGLPLAGDKLYSPAPRQKFWKTRGLRRMFLHAHQVSFLDGKGNEQMVSCPLPGELKDLLEKLESGL
jgi:23S rRNA pseudouridine955/2504/2580 synthase